MGTSTHKPSASDVLIKGVSKSLTNLSRPCPVGSREGRIVLVQFSSRGMSEDGGRFTVKKYHSVKSTTPEGWKHEKIELMPLNPDYDPITVEPQDASEMMIVGEFVTVLA